MKELKFLELELVSGGLNMKVPDGKCGRSDYIYDPYTGYMKKRGSIG